MSSLADGDLLLQTGKAGRGSLKDTMKRLRDDIIGIDASFEGPFGMRQITYCDFVASGKPVKYIEKFVTRHVLPFYANTHTTTSYGALHTGKLREESRAFIKQCVNATADDVLIFTGAGSTAAIHKLINAIEIHKMDPKKTVVMMGPYEHHSNILPWREAGVEMVRLKETVHGEVDMEKLEIELRLYHSNGYKIITSISACSNITGILTDTTAISALVHEFQGFAFWDYACAAPYVEIDMNASSTGYKDAMYISPHKFLGGVGTPGILIAKRKLFTNRIPAGVGGGTVVYVTRSVQSYVSNVEEREEGGTPAIVESIRAGLAFQLKQSIGTDNIERLEEELCQKAFKFWKGNDNILILGSWKALRLPIFSFLIGHPATGKFLHQHFVSILLNDLYGIQARGGCACAGPYATDLMCMDDDTALRLSNYEVREKHTNKLIRRLEIMKPGFTRVNLPYFMDGETTDFLLRAVDQVANNGWKLLPLYEFEPVAGLWKHREFQGVHPASITSARLTPASIASMPQPNQEPFSHKEVLGIADEIYRQALELTQNLDLSKEQVGVEEGEEHKIWFLEPRVALLALRTPVRLNVDHSEKMDFAVRRNTVMLELKELQEAMHGSSQNKGSVPIKPMFIDSFGSAAELS